MMPALTTGRADDVELTAGQAAVWLGIGAERVRSLIDRGEMGRRVGRDRKLSIGESVLAPPWSRAAPDGRHALPRRRDGPPARRVTRFR